jgi:hypothetical protein
MRPYGCGFDGAAECCREFEGVPQYLFFPFPQEWGIKGG